MAVKITEKTLKALRIIHEFMLEKMRKRWLTYGMTATQFAGLMWPDSAAWKTSYGGCSTDRGPVTGTGIVMSAGSYLSKLYYRRLVRFQWKQHTKYWHLTDRGLEALQKAKQEEGGRSCRKTHRKKS